MESGSGVDFLEGGAGADPFVFADGFGRNSVLDFTVAAGAGGAGADRVDVAGLTGADEFADHLIALAHQRDPMRPDGPGADPELLGDAGGRPAPCDMFEPDAVAKGLHLRIVPATTRVAVPSLAIMRCPSNIVSNAIKFTEWGSVLVGVGRRAGHVSLEVHESGAGMSAQDFDHALGRAQAAGKPG